MNTEAFLPNDHHYTNLPDMASHHPCSLLWFRTDLRLQDHESLTRALASSQALVPVYVFDPRMFAPTQYGWSKTGFFRTRFLIEAVVDLRARLQALGSELIVCVGKPEVELAKLAEKAGATAVYAHAEATSEETGVEQRLEKALWRIKGTLYLSHGHSLYHADDLPHPVRALPDVFTTWRKDVERLAQVRPLQPAPGPLPPLPAGLEVGRIPTSKDLGVDEVIQTGPELDYHVQGGETAALAHLDKYLERGLLSTYKATRNGLIGMDYSSKLSAWLSAGCISPRTVYWRIKDYEARQGANESTYWLVFELLWRDYFWFVARKYGDKIFHPEGIRGLDQRLGHDWGLFRKWQDGHTGLPFIDANMRQMAATGFMSNRGRQNVASFLVKDMRQDWLLGASYFEHLLIDYDPTSNYGNWCYVAGVGNDPRPNRYFNTIKQAKDYDAKGDFVRLWVPEVAALPTEIVHEPYRATSAQQDRLGFKLSRDYFRPVVQLERRMNA